jgi:NIMA (never in mitosis gene a)-related kinase
MRQETPPEGFMRHTLLELSEALSYFVHGARLDNFDADSILSGPPRTWNAIVHRDIKPGNFFLTTSASGNIYPRVVLGDFDCKLRRTLPLNMNSKLTPVLGSVPEKHIYQGFTLEFTSRQAPTSRPPEHPNYYRRRSDVF